MFYGLKHIFYWISVIIFILILFFFSIVPVSAEKVMCIELFVPPGQCVVEIGGIASLVPWWVLHCWCYTSLVFEPRLQLCYNVWIDRFGGELLAGGVCTWHLTVSNFIYSPRVKAYHHRSRDIFKMRHEYFSRKRSPKNSPTKVDECRICPISLGKYHGHYFFLIQIHWIIALRPTYDRR